MSAIDPRTPVDDLHRLAAELGELSRRLDLLEAPTGTSAYRTVAKLSALVNDIQAQLDAYNATRWTNAQIEALIDMKVAAYVGSYMSGNVTVGGAFRVLGDAQVDGAIRAPGVRNTDLTSVSNRIIVWQGGPADPRLGHT